jgi:membrane protein YdbS with pleckstrin-like domain
MPVIPCPDCQRDVSTLAPACPHCGRPSPAGTTPIDAPPPLPQQEETLWRGTPSWTVLFGYVAVMALTLVVIPAVAYLMVASSADLEARDRLVRGAWMLTIILLLVEVVAFAVALLKLRSTVYTVTNQRVMIETGLLSKHLSEIDLRYIDDSQFSQGLIHRILGIGNVTLISTDKTTPVQMLRAVPDPRGVRELIRSHAYRISHRQIFTRAT